MQTFTLRRIGYGWSLLLGQLLALIFTGVYFLVAVVVDGPLVQESKGSFFVGPFNVILFLLGLYLALSAILTVPLVWVTALANWLLSAPINCGLFGVSGGFDLSDERDDEIDKRAWVSALGPGWFVLLLPALLLLCVVPVLLLALWLMGGKLL